MYPVVAKRVILIMRNSATGNAKYQVSIAISGCNKGLTTH